MASLGMVYRESTPHQVKCELCKKVTHQSYRVQVGDLGLMRFCSGLHAQMAINNYNENKEKGLSPNNTEPIVDETQESDTGDNV